MKTQKSTYEAFREAEPFVVSLAYRGSFTDEMTASFVDISENTIEDFKGLPKVSKRVSFLLVECFQNIIRHGSIKESKSSRTEDDGIFCFRNKVDEYTINGINFMDKDDVRYLVQAIEEVNVADKDALRKMYAKRLTEEGFSAKGGAGLGFIAMARKSGQPIHYRLENPMSDRPIFHQQVTYVPEDNFLSKSYIEDTDQTYHQMLDKKVILQYKGDFSQKSIMPIIQILEANFDKSPNEINKRKRMIHLLIEMLQNISKHGALHNECNDGIFSIAEEDGNMTIETGNLVNRSDLLALRARLDAICHSDDDELKSMHREQLLNCTASNDKANSGLGLIEIARYSSDKLKYNITHMSDELSFLTLKACA